MLVSDYSMPIIPYGTCLPEAKGFTACSQGLSEATPLENAPYDASRQGCQQRFSFVGDDDRCDERRWHALRGADTLTRWLGTRGVARASLNPGLMAEIPSGCEKTKSDSNLKPLYLNAIRS